MAEPGAPGRAWGSLICVVAGTATLVVAVLAGWADRDLFDSEEFADRAVVVLEDARARQAVAEAIADELVNDGVSDVVAFRGALLPLVVDVVGTPAFEDIFREAVVTAHRAAVSRHAGTAVLELGETIEILTSSSAVSNPGLAQTLETRASTLLVDAAPVLDRLHLYRLSERVRWLDEAAAVATLVLFALAAVFDRRRRRAVRRIGHGTLVAGVVVAAVTLLAPHVAAFRIADSTLAAAVDGAVRRFTSDLLTLGLWVTVIGILVAAAASAAGVPRPQLAERAREAWTAVEGSRRGRAIGGAVALAVAAVVLVLRDSLLNLLLLAAGIAIAYVGAVLVVSAAFGEVPAARATLPPPRRTARTAAAVAVAVVVVAAVTVGAVATVRSVRSHAAGRGPLECNGSADLCDRRLDEVTLPGAHNAMSAASNPGWLFPEQLLGIPALLEYGVRALLVKTHYGTPTGVQLGGTELVVTNVAAESTVSQKEETSELSADAVARAQELEATVPAQAGDRTIYLCHVYCSLGATPFQDVLGQLKAFMDRNPHEVVVLFIGDYVSPEDTEAAFQQAGLAERVWTYDQSAPPPTLRQMIEARQTLMVLSEHAGGTPGWYTPGYGIFQETPFTFAAPSDFNCNPNRGPADAPLFELNHFITTTEPPSVDTARQVNAYDVLMGRARQCMAERKLLPTIVAVNFANQGDLLEVVGDLNELPPGAATTATLPATSAPTSTAATSTSTTAG